MWILINNMAVTMRLKMWHHFMSWVLRFASARYCLKSFTANSTLKTHIASVHDEIRHQCNKCTKSYSQLNTLQAHIKKQHPQTTTIESQKLPFQNCLWCIWKFPNFKQFVIHAKHYHPKLVAGLLNNDDFK